MMEGRGAPLFYIYFRCPHPHWGGKSREEKLAVELYKSVMANWGRRVGFCVYIYIKDVRSVGAGAES